MNLGSFANFIEANESFEGENMKDRLVEQGIQYLYHFSAESNIKSIKGKGLYPRSILQSQSIKFVAGGNDWSLGADDREGLDQYVHLCLFKNHPMKYQLENDESDKRKFKWIKVDLSVLDFPGVKYTLDVSNKAGVALLSETEALKKYDFEALNNLGCFDFKSSREKQKRRASVEKYEILVPCAIPVNLITIL